MKAIRCANGHWYDAESYEKCPHCGEECQTTQCNSNDNTKKSYIQNKPTDLANTAYVASAISTLLSTMYPVGSIYIGTQASCPMGSLITGSTWALVSSGKALWTGDGTNGNTTIAAGLPNITGSIKFSGIDPGTTTGTASGAFKKSNANGAGNSHNSSIANGLITFNFSASDSNSIYGKSTTVQPPAYVVNVWRRTA